MAESSGIGFTCEIESRQSSMAFQLGKEEETRDGDCERRAAVRTLELVLDSAAHAASFRHAAGAELVLDVLETVRHVDWSLLMTMIEGREGELCTLMDGHAWGYI